METAECNIIITHLVQCFSGKFIAKKCWVTFDKCIEFLFCQKIGCNTFDFLRRTAMQCGKCNGITDIRSDSFNIFCCHMFELTYMIQQILLTDFEGFCISCILHTFNECVDFPRLDTLQIITNTDIELETIHTAKAVFLCHKGKQEPCLNVFILCLRNIKLGRPLTVVSFVIRFDTWLVDTCCQFITIHDLNGFQFKETAAGIIRSRNILS